MSEISSDPVIQARFEELVAAGESPRFAEILATRKFPGLRTDSTFNEGRCNGNQFEQCPALGDYYRRAAEDAGVSTTGKTYQRSLAEFPGDPAAWVNGRGDVERVAKEKGFKVSGSVNYTPPEAEPMADTKGVAPDIINREVDAILELNPGAKRDDVAGYITDLRSGKIDPNPLLVDD